MLRLGLCCIFREQPIRFRQTTAKALSNLSRGDQLSKLSELCMVNVLSLKKALRFTAENGIGAFRILTPLFPRYTHPNVGYTLDDLPDAVEIKTQLTTVKQFGQEKDIRLSFHPDQFNVMSTPHQDVIRNTLFELEYQGMLAELVGAEVINIHAGGKYGNKEEALSRLKKNFLLLSERVSSRLTIENDDISFSPADLIPVCRELHVPFVYDVHHHRCLPDDMSEEEATMETVSLWREIGREPYFHISSPKNGWQKGNPKPHADYIDPRDFPSCWFGLNATVDVEAKAKELAVLKLKQDLDL